MNAVSTPTDTSLVYVADVMCSWCWGFAPTIERLRAELGLDVLIVNGGLRPGDSAEGMSPKMVAFLSKCWQDVGQASGQPFDMAGLSKPEGWRYDTEPPARLVATVREQVGPQEALTLFHRMQEAFYAEAVDVTDPTTWQELMQGLVSDPVGIRAEALSADGRKRAWQDFSQARAWGITGFPCLLLREGDELSLVTRGWAPDDAVVDGVRSYLEEKAAKKEQEVVEAMAEGDICAIDGDAC